MSEIQVVNQTEPATPSTGDSVIYIDSSDKTLKSKDSNGVVHNYGLADTSIISAISSLQNTCVLEGCIPSVNALDNTKFDLSSGVAIFSDAHINPSNPTIYRLNYAGSTGNVNTRLTTNTETFILIDSSGVIHLTDFPSVLSLPSQTLAPCGGLIHSGKTINEGATPACGCVDRTPSRSLAELGASIGIINLNNGNIYSPNGANLQINKSSGYLFSIGLNRTAENQNVLSIPALTPSYISYTFRNGSGGFVRSSLVTSINPSRYDDGTGGTTQPNGLVGTKVSVQYIFLPGPFTQIQYGQHLYDDIATAISAINNAIHEENPILLNSCFRGWLVVKGNATDLSDPTQAQFFSADKFGTHVVTGGIKQGTATLSAAYKNGSIEPEIKLDSTRGSVVIQDADTSIAAPLFEVKNSNGVKDIFDVEPSQIKMGEKLRMESNAIAWDDVRCVNLRTVGTLQPVFAKLRDTGSGSVGVFAYKFDPAKAEEIHGTIQLPHDYKEGTDIVAHIHFTTENNLSGNIVWGIEYSWTNYNSVIPVTEITEITVANPGAYTHAIANFNTISGTGKTISSVFHFRIYRNGPTAADTYSGLASLLEVDIHVQKDSIGSLNVGSKG